MDHLKIEVGTDSCQAGIEVELFRDSRIVGFFYQVLAISKKVYSMKHH